VTHLVPDGFQALRNLFRACNVSLGCTGKISYADFAKSRLTALKRLPLRLLKLRLQEAPKKL
jgi:hypothetical protein